jgi:ABC-type sugar transport system ATPase subunit
VTDVSAPFLTVRGITKRFPGVTAVEDVSLTVQPGQTIGLVGPNGAGKSTLIKILAGAVRPDGGEILIDGRVVDVDRPHRATALGLSFVHQELADVPALSVAENVFLGLGYPRRLGLFADRERLRRATQSILTALDSDIRPDAPVAGLSVAQQRLVMIARGLAANARLLVLDEPSASLTATEIEHLHAVVRMVAARGTTVVYVSHRLDEILSLTTRVVVMRNGRVVTDVPTESLDRKTLITHIVGHVPDRPDAGRPSATARSEAPLPEILQVEHLSAGIVSDVSFTVRAGEIVGIAGLVGAGRTELVRLIFGAERPAYGRVLVLGESVCIRNPRDALAAGIVLLPEDRRSQGLALDRSVRENVTLPSLRRFRRLSWLPFPRLRAERSRTQELITEIGIRTTGEAQPAGLLSGGNQQKVVLAKWLVHGARVFIFDEPTHGVDVGGKSEIHALMSRLATEGNGVLFISSEFEELEEVCRRVLVMREGRIVAELRDGEVNLSNMLGHCYGDAVAVHDAGSNGRANG